MPTTATHTPIVAAGRDRLMLALDVPTVEAATTIVRETEGTVGVYKIGLQLAFAGGIEFARVLKRQGHRVFLDVKLHDIGNQVKQAVRSIAALGVDFVTVHAYPPTLAAAVAGRDAGGGGPAILGVTVLTSMDDADLAAAGYALSTAELVARRARQTAEAGAEGLVCSPLEARAVRALVPGLTIVTPGVRPAGAAAGDQKRIMTPSDARAAGADFVVVGRPILDAGDRRAAASAIAAELDAFIA